MRILLLYPGATWSPYDVATGYEAALKNLGHDVHTYQYHNIYEFYQGYLGYISKQSGKLFPIDAAMVLASEHAVIEALDVWPDVILNVMGVGLHRRGFELLRRTPFPHALILTESPYMDRGQALICKKGYVHLAFANDRASLPRLEGNGFEVAYLPHSYDPWRHRPMDVGPEYDTDVFFHGTFWPERKALMEGLELPIGTRAAITGTKFDPADLSVENLVDNSEMIKWYNGTKIALNHNRRVMFGGGTVEMGQAWSLGPRAFEIAACGTFQLCDDTRPELFEVFGDSVGVYKSRQDLQDKIAYYLAHDDEREEMAAESRRRVEGCSFVGRARDVVVPALEGLLQ